MGERVGEKFGISETLITKAYSLTVKSHKSKHGYIKDTKEPIFAFGGSWSVQDFYSHEPFGETKKFDVSMFPSLKSIGTNEPATINEAFFHRFEAVLTKSFIDEVKEANKKEKTIIFTGHSSGGPVAILAAVWYLEKHTRIDGKTPCKCITFGSPLVGDSIFAHALNRENWAENFIHFVGRYDIVPRIMLSPLLSHGNEFVKILDYLKLQNLQKSSITIPEEASSFFTNVLMNASSVASHVVCTIMGSTNSLLENISSFVKLSPYRPSGNYIFCTGNGKLVSVSNSNAVLQILFYCCQPADEAELTDAAKRSLCMDYDAELKGSLIDMQDVVYLFDNTKIPLSSNGNDYGDTADVNNALKDLGLSTSARLCLQAAQAFEEEKKQNQKTIESKIHKIEEWHKTISDYQKGSKIGYYDSFKLQNGDIDFTANVTRLELAGIWDEIIEMLKRYELPDGFESDKEWIKRGTEFRKLVEPLDIANFYRHSKDEDTGIYNKAGVRPKRYWFTQRWLEHALKLKEGSCSETTFWADVEENKRKPFEEIKEKVIALEKQVDEWVENKELGEKVLSEESTFVKWWKTFPENYRSVSCLRKRLG